MIAINLFISQEDTGLIQVPLRMWTPLIERGCWMKSPNDFLDPPPEFEVTLIQTDGKTWAHPNDGKTLDDYETVILSGTKDPSSSLFQEARYLLFHPHVKRMLRLANYPRDYLNTYGDAWYEYSEKLGESLIPLSEEAYNKIVVGPGYYAYDFLKYWWENPPVPLNGDRSIDIHFIGNIDDYPVESVSAHRRACVKALEPFSGPKMVGPRQYEYEEYCSQLVQSKIVVSPFGMGQLCFRDFEAMYAGCVLVKPHCGPMIIYPNQMIPDITYVAVQWDWSDLLEKIDYVLQNYDSYEEMRRFNQETLHQHASVDSLADYWANLFALK